MKAKKYLILGVVPLLFGAGRLFGAPAIGSFTPAFGASSDPGYITINGSGFYPGTLVVKFNGVTDPTATPTSADGTVIQARVPAGATNGANPIFVSVNGAGTFSGQDFTVIGSGPYVSGFSPMIGGAGAPVTINGAHFTMPLTVKFNGLTASGASAPTAAQISVNAPSGVTSGPISVTTSSGSYTSAVNFYVPPGISGFNPTSGGAGTNIIITGTNFLGTTAVRFNGVDAMSITVLSNGAIRVTVPGNATTGQLRVITPAGSAFSGSNFVVRPIISDFFPGSGPVGTPVTINGANFSGTPTVKFNGVTAVSVSGVTFNQLTANVPAGATTGPITVTTTDGTATSATNFFVPPAIIGFSPSNGPPGSLISVTGVNFTAASAVAFNGTPAANFFVTNNNSLGAIVPVGVTTGPISVTTPAGTMNSQAKFYGAPVITSFDPTHGLPGTNVTLIGLNFLDASAVRFNGSNATFSVVNNTTLNATVPVNAQTGPITVVTPGGTTNSAQNFVLDYTANLSVTVSDSPDPVVVGSNVVYVLTIANAGPFAASGVTLTDTLIGPALLKSATTSQGTLTTNTFPITGALGQINAGGSVIVTLTVTAQAEGMITNIATVASQQPDPTPANNSFTSTTYVQPLPILTVRRVGTDRVRIIWSAALTNYGLEFKPLLAATNFWSNTITLPLLIGGEYQLTETNSEAMRYYRLRRLP